MSQAAGSECRVPKVGTLSLAPSLPWSPCWPRHSHAHPRPDHLLRMGELNREMVLGLWGRQYLGACDFGIVPSPEKSQARARGPHGPWVVSRVCAGPFSSPAVENRPQVGRRGDAQGPTYSPAG